MFHQTSWEMVDSSRTFFFCCVVALCAPHRDTLDGVQLPYVGCIKTSPCLACASKGHQVADEAPISLFFPGSCGGNAGGASRLAIA
jgi:hypothetical protein